MLGFFNTAAITSGYAGRDSQGNDRSVLVFFLSLLDPIKDFFLVFEKKKEELS